MRRIDSNCILAYGICVPTPIATSSTHATNAARTFHLNSAASRPTTQVASGRVLGISQVRQVGYFSSLCFGMIGVKHSHTTLDTSHPVTRPLLSLPPPILSSKPDYGTTKPSHATKSIPEALGSPSGSSDKPDVSRNHLDQATEAAPQRDWRLVGAGALLALLIVGGSVAAATGLINFDTFVLLAEWFESLGPNAIVLYAALYFALELIAVPALPLTLGSGYLFGVMYGTVAVSISSTLAAVAAFLIARYGLRDAVANLASRYPRFRAMDRAIGREGFKFVLLLRLSPLLPFSLSNYLYGLTSVDVVQYSVASWLGMLPGTIAYVSAGAAVGALTDLGSGEATKVNPYLVGIGIVATVGVLVAFGRVASQAVSSIEEEEGSEEENV